MVFDVIARDVSRHHVGISDREHDLRQLRDAATAIGTIGAPVIRAVMIAPGLQ